MYSQCAKQRLDGNRRPWSGVQCCSSVMICGVLSCKPASLAHQQCHQLHAYKHWSAHEPAQVVLPHRASLLLSTLAVTKETLPKGVGMRDDTTHRGSYPRCPTGNPDVAWEAGQCWWLSTQSVGQSRPGFARWTLTQTAASQWGCLSEMMCRGPLTWVLPSPGVEQSFGMAAVAAGWVLLNEVPAG